MARNTTAIAVGTFNSSVAGNTPNVAEMVDQEIAINSADGIIWQKVGGALAIIYQHKAPVAGITSTSDVDFLAASQGKVLADLISGLGTIHPATNAADRDAQLAAGTVGNKDVIHVSDDGDGNWARYQNLGTSAAPNLIKVADQDAVAAGLGATNLSYNAATREVENTSGNNATLPLATQTVDGLMTKEDKAKIDNLNFNVGTF